MPEPTEATPPAADPAADYDYGGVPPEVPSNPPAAPAPAAIPPAPQGPQHPAYLVRMATDLGIPAADIATHTTEGLQHIVEYENRRLALMARENARAAAVAQPPAPPAPPVVPQEEEALFEDESLVDETLVAAVKKVDPRKRLKSLEDKLDGMEKREQQREAATIEDAIDNAFVALGAEYEKYFGKGVVRELQADSAEVKRRLAVLNAAGIDFSKRPTATLIATKIKAAVGLIYPAPPPASAYDEATRGAAAQPVAQPLPRDQAGRITGRRISPEQWNNAALQRPTQRANPTETPSFEKAVKAVEKMQAEQGTPVNNNTTLEGFPE